MEYNQAVFIDRDGTINDKTPAYYIYTTANFKLIEGVGANLKKLQDAGYLLIVITNQGGIDKGEYTHKDVARVHRYMRELLESEGVQLTDVFYCPHHSDVQECECRKPGTLLIEEAIEMYEIDRERSWFIGDSDVDMEAAKRAGLRKIRVETNKPWGDAIQPILDDVYKP